MFLDVLRICREEILSHLELSDICSLFLALPTITKNTNTKSLVKYNKRKIIIETQKYATGEVGFITDTACPTVYHIVLNPSKKVKL